MLNEGWYMFQNLCNRWTALILNRFLEIILFYLLDVELKLFSLILLAIVSSTPQHQGEEGTLLYMLILFAFLRNKTFLIFTQPLRSGRIWHKVKFSAEFNRFEFSFPSPRLVASPRLKNLVCPTICP